MNRRGRPGAKWAASQPVAQPPQPRPSHRVHRAWGCPVAVELRKWRPPVCPTNSSMLRHVSNHAVGRGQRIKSNDQVRQVAVAADPAESASPPPPARSPPSVESSGRHATGLTVRVHDGSGPSSSKMTQGTLRWTPARSNPSGKQKTLLSDVVTNLDDQHSGGSSPYRRPRPAICSTSMMEQLSWVRLFFVEGFFAYS